jgi:hypothetical protein
MEMLKKMSFEEGSAYLKENGFWESDTAVDESAKVADVYFTNEDDETISFVTVYSKMERAEDGSWDTEIEKEYWEEL